MLIEHESHAAMFLHDHGPLFCFRTTAFYICFYSFLALFVIHMSSKSWRLSTVESERTDTWSESLLKMNLRFVL
jgi:hypothetical protein